MAAVSSRFWTVLVFCLQSTVAAEQPRTATVPPVFPLAYVGKLFVDGAPPTVYLRDGTDMQAGTVGQVVAGTFRIDAIETHAMRVTHLPSGAQQTLDYAMMRVTPAPAAAPTVAARRIAPLPPPPPVTEVPPGVLVPFIGR